MNQVTAASAQTSGPKLCKTRIAAADQDQSLRPVVPRNAHKAQTAARSPSAPLMQAQAILALEGCS